MIADRRNEPDQLLADARAGRKECLGSLLQLYRNYLHLLARTQIDLYLQRSVNPSDVVQETFLRASRNFDQFRGDSEQEFIGWLRSILLHELARVVERQLRTQKRDARKEISLQQRAAALDRSSAVIDAALISQVSSPSAQAQRRESVSVVADQLARLSPDHHEVIVLRNLHGLSFDEVARRMGRSPGAVRALWLRALEQLRQSDDGKESA